MNKKLAKRAGSVFAAVALGSMALAGCSSDDTNNASEETSVETTDTTTSEEASAAPIVLSDAYIKEKPADKDMTAIFGVINNNTDEELSLTSFCIEGLAEGTLFEQHEVVDGQMREVQDGLKIPAGGKLELKPGGEHLMILDNPDALEQGQEFTIVLTFSDGSELTQDIPARVQAAGEEEYAPSGAGSDHEHGDHDGHGHGNDHDHADHDHADHEHGDHH